MSRGFAKKVKIFFQDIKIEKGATKKAERVKIFKIYRLPAE
jgi:hypothetical protein